MPDVDAIALETARAADELLLVANEMGIDRWARYFARIPDRLRDDPILDLRAAGRLVRSAYGPRDSVRDSLPEAVTEPLLAATDRLLKAIARYEAHR